MATKHDMKTQDSQTRESVSVDGNSTQKITGDIFADLEATLNEVAETNPRINLKLADGSIVFDGRAASPARVRRLGEAGHNAVLEIALREGRNRQLRRMIEAVGGRVLGLERVAFGPVELGELPVGKVREATTEEYRLLHKLMPAQR